MDKPAPLICRRSEPVSVEAEAEPNTAMTGMGYEAPSTTRYPAFSERAAPANLVLRDEDLEEAEVYTAPGYAARETGDSHLPLKRGEECCACAAAITARTKRKTSKTTRQTNRVGRSQELRPRVPRFTSVPPFTRR